MLWMGLIFYMSSQPQLESEATSNLATEIIFKVYAILLSSSHMEVSDFFALYGQPIRKLAHFTEFLILGILAYSNIREYTKKHLFLYPLLFSVLYAISDEIHQLFVEGRFCALKDMLIDSSGALTGILLCHLIKRLCQRKD